MAQIVGLDIGTRTIAGAVFTGNSKKFRLADFFVEEIPTLESVSQAAAGEMVLPPSLAEVVEKVLSARGLKHADVIAGLDAKDCILREIPVPFTKDEHIKKTILSEAENHFQTFDIAEVQLEYFKVEEIGQKSRVLIAAVRNSVIKERLDLLRQAEVDPLALDLDATALFNGFALTPTFDPERNTLLIDMGATSTKVLLVEKGKLRKIRSIRMDSFLGRRSGKLIPEPAAALAVGAAAGGGSGGSLPFSDSYSIEARFAEIENALRRLDPMSGEETGLGGEEEPIAILTDEEFDLVRRGGVAAREDSEGGTNGGKPSPAANGGPAAAAGPAKELDYRDYLERLSIEIQRTFASSSPGSGVELICLTGGMSRREEARRFFTEEFDVETIDLDFGDSFPMDLAPEAQPELSRVGAVAVGLAMKELGRDRIGFDFRKGEFRFERKFERVKYPILCVGALLFLVFFMAMLDLVNEYRRHSLKLKYVQDQEQTLYEAFFGKKNSSDLLFPQASIEKKNWERILGVGGGNIPAFIPVMDALEEVSKGYKEVAAQARLEILDLKLRTRKVNQKVAAEGSSSLTLSTPETGLGTKLEKAFGKPGQIFSASASETRSPNGNVKINVTWTPQDKYLNDLRK